MSNAVRWFRRAATQGLAEAHNNLGSAYLEDSGVSADAGEAVHWFREAAEQGNPGGQYNLGTAYAQGRGVDRDMAQAVPWWRMTAEQGVITTQYDMGVVNAEGITVEQSDAGAVYWFATAAVASNTRAREAIASHADKLPTKQVIAKWVRVRAGASTDTAIIGHVGKGDRLPMLGHNRNDWSMVYLADGQQLGRVANRLLSDNITQ